MAEIIQLPTQAGVRTPVGHIIRTGEQAIRRSERLLVQDRLTTKKVIVDASKAMVQREFISAIRETGGDVILDTKAAELSELRKFQGWAKAAPWARTDENRPLIPSDFEVGSNFDIYGSIARYAIELGVSTVMAPTHFLRNGADDVWFSVDKRGVHLLRNALDREGGSNICIDYPLILTHSTLQDLESRRKLIFELNGLPVDNLVVRLSGFGSDARPFSISRTFIALEDLHSLSYPIVLDHVGGLVALGAIAFGFVSSISHGIGECQRFDAREWHKPKVPRDPSQSGGPQVYIPVPGADKSLNKNDIEYIASLPKGRRLVVCQDKKCCPMGFESMLQLPHSHMAYQNRKSVSELERIPDIHRVNHFLDNNMRNAERKAGELMRLKIEYDRLKKSLTESRKRIDNMARMFEALSERDRPMPKPMQRSSAAGELFGRDGQ